MILNKTAGTVAALERRDLLNAFRALGLSPHVVYARGAEVGPAAARAAAAGDTLVAAGGDGTVSSVAAVAVQTGAAFGVIPAGTLNHFARDAGIPSDLHQAVALIARGTTRRVDVGEVNGRPFVNNVSLGMYPRLVWERQLEQQRGRRKWTALAIALVRSWNRYRLVTVRMVVNGETLVRRSPLVLIGNNEYGLEGLELGRRSSLDAGILSVYLAPEAGRFELLALAARARARRLTAEARLEAFTTAALTIETARHRFSIGCDGELVRATPPLRLHSRPGALRLIAPEAR